MESIGLDNVEQKLSSTGRSTKRSNLRILFQAALMPGDENFKKVFESEKLKIKINKMNLFPV